jgi:EmrB/QacA subfamily drug resistance transporter
MSIPQDRIDRRVWIIAATCSGGPLMSGLDATMVNIALDTIARAHGAALGTVQWVSSAYLLALALALPITGWLVDRVGARLVFLFSFAVFMAGSALCATAGSIEALIGFRVIQGIAGGLLAPMMQLMMARHAGRHMARVIGVAAMPVMVGQMAGPSLGGLILVWLDWHWIFLVNLPVGLLAIGFAWRVLPVDEPNTPRPLDLVGLAMISPGLALLMESLVALSQGQASAPWTLALSVALLGGFAWHALRRPRTALIDLRLFRGRVFQAAAVTQFLSNAINFGGQFLMPLFFLNPRGLDTGLAGLLLGLTGLGVFLALPIMGRLSERFGARMISGAGALIALIGTLPFALVGLDAPLWFLALALLVRGFGQGSITLPSAAAAYASVPRESLTSATTAINICQRVGGPAGTAGLAIFLQHMLATAGTPDIAYTAAMWLLAGLAAAGVAAAARLPGPNRTEHAS